MTYDDEPSYDQSPNHPHYEQCQTIEQRDPAGWEVREPTDADYAAHEAWAIERFGRSVWHTYKNVDWSTWGTNPV